MELITSVRNPKVLSWRSLKEKKSRDELHAFLIEGPKMVEEALLSPFPVLTVLVREGYTPSFPVPDTIPVYVLSESVFQSVCDTKTPQGIAAVAGISVQALKGSLLLALDGIQDYPYGGCRRLRGHHSFSRLYGRFFSQSGPGNHGQCLPDGIQLPGFPAGCAVFVSEPGIFHHFFPAGWRSFLQSESGTGAPDSDYRQRRQRGLR